MRSMLTRGLIKMEGDEIPDDTSTGEARSIDHKNRGCEPIKSVAGARAIAQTVIEKEVRDS